MDPIQWLERNAGGFNGLTDQERLALMHFPLLWSYFEAEVLHANGSAAKISDWIHYLDQQKRLNAVAFSPALDYFKARYYSGNAFTHHFDSLNLRANDSPDMVRDVLSGSNNDPIDSVVVLFIIIYRFRNNYFHGPKWAYQLQGQLDNFNAANDSIIRVIEMWRA